MNRFLKGFLIIFGGLAIVGALIYLKIHLSSQNSQSGIPALENADTARLLQKISADSLYHVKDVLFHDSAILIAVDNPEKTGTEAYFDRKYKLNGYGNINMVYIYQYDSLKSLSSLSFDDALMATGKKMGRFQKEWVVKYIDTLDGSCVPLKKWIQSSYKTGATYKNQETVYQPANIHNMEVVCKYFITDSLGVPGLHIVTAVVDKDGQIQATKENGKQ